MFTCSMGKNDAFFVQGLEHEAEGTQVQNLSTEEPSQGQFS